MNNFEKQSRQYDCGGEHMERYVNTNMSKIFPKEAKNKNVTIKATLKKGKLQRQRLLTLKVMQNNLLLI